MIKLGVVGVGVIGTAMVKGLKKKYGDDIEIFLSPRNTAKAEGLAKAFSGVTVMGSNQEVLDAADWIIFSVLRPSRKRRRGRLHSRRDTRLSA